MEDPSENDRLISVSQEPHETVLQKRLRESSRFRHDDKLMMFLYAVVGAILLVVLFKYGPAVPKLNFKAIQTTSQITVQSDVCPSLCGKGFHHTTRDGKKVLSDCEAMISCTRIRMDKSDRGDLDVKWGMNPVPAHPDQKVKMMFAVKQENMDKLEQRLYELSDPLHPDYGKWMTADEVDDLTSPLSHRISTIKSWIKTFGFDSHEIEHLTPNADILGITASVRQANAMLDGTLHEFCHIENGLKILRLASDSYTLPDFIADHVDLVTPNVRFHTVARPDSEKFAADSTVPGTCTPAVLRQLYSLPEESEYPAPQAHQSQAFLELIGGRYSKEDIKKMWSQYHVRPSKLDRYPADQTRGEGDESIMDGTCFTMSGSGVRTVGWTPGHNHFFLEFLMQMRNMHPDARPDVVSMSYSSDEQADGEKYVKRTNEEFMKLTIQGHTFLASSGDFGVRGIKDKCYHKDQYIPSYPASSPYVVGVGGTDGGVFNPANTREQAWSGSGGGFSVFSPRPKYQNEAVKSYLGKVKVQANHMNVEGAGYPDVSASAGAFPMFVSGFQTEGGGTSGSSPFIGGLISVLNLYRLKDGKSKMGFVNPLFYHLYNKQHADKNGKTYFHDVTEGSTTGCPDSNNEGNVGFHAAQGWDPTTGVGTPNVKAILYFLQHEQKSSS